MKKKYFTAKYDDNNKRYIDNI